MTNLEQLAKIIRAHRSDPTARNISSGTTYRHCISKCEYVFIKNGQEEADHIAQAIHDAGWTAPIQPTTPSYLDN